MLTTLKHLHSSIMEYGPNCDDSDSYTGQLLILVKKCTWHCPEDGNSKESHLKKGLEGTGFRPSAMDPCLFISDKDTADIDHVIHHMINAGFQLRVEDDAVDDGSIALKQTALVQRIIDTFGFQNANRKVTPAEVAELPADVDGPGPQEHWSYALCINVPDVHIICVVVMKRL
eukprot:6549614-Ditylum_brightwellii.AAC.1